MRLFIERCLLGAALGMGCAGSIWTPAGFAQDEAAEPVATDSSAEPLPEGADSYSVIETSDREAALPESEAAPSMSDEPVPGEQGLEEVVVTAQKRAESLQDTPISLVAFDADELAQRGISNVEDLSGNVPGITVEPFPTQSSTLRIFIRGVGLNESQVTQDPAVGVYQDGVYIARSSGLALDIADLERIEVLRGPQGTLYGRNTTGGAVNLVTRKPDPTQAWAKMTLGGAERQQASVKAVVNLPVTDTAAIKLSGLFKQADGFVENTGVGGDFGDNQAAGARFDARWLPQDWLTIDYAFDYTDAQSYAPLYQAILRPLSDKGTAEVIKGFAELNTVYSSRRLDHLATGSEMAESSTEIQGHALTLTLPIAEHYEFKYIGAYRELDDHYYTDLGGGAGSTEYRLDTGAYDGPAADMAYGGPTPLVIPNLKQHQWSHELQFNASLLDDQVDFIAGAFAFSESATDRTPYSHQVNSRITPGGLSALLTANPDLSNQILSLTAPNLVGFNMRDYRAHNEAVAAYAQMTWSPLWVFDERLHLTIGYRHSEDQREAIKSYVADNYIEGNINGQGTAILLPGDAPFDNVKGQREYTDDSLSYLTGYELTPSINVYGKYVEGYKSGGFNLRDPQIDGSEPASDGVDYGVGFIDGFAPEYVTSTELGFKSEWFGRRWRVNADVFESDYRDMQVNFLISGTSGDTKTRNAGKARIRGFEIENTVAAASWLRVSAEYSYLDAKVLDIRDIDGNNVADQYPFASAPRHSGIVALDTSLYGGDWGEVRGYLTYNYTSKRDGGGLPGRSDLTYLPAYDVINARIGINEVHVGSGVLDVAVFCRNLLDEEYPTTAIPQLPQSDRAVTWGEPRLVGAELSYRW
jgi:iron complex outermembrane receptor protein